jgi:hypothetical protein
MLFNKPKLTSSMAIARYRRFCGFLLALLAMAILPISLMPAPFLRQILSYVPLRCPVNFLFGWHCPTCGLGRATIALLQGDFAKSWAYHPAALILSTGTALIFLWSLVSPAHLEDVLRKIRRSTLSHIYSSISGSYILASLIGLYFIWGLVRTLPQ